MNVEVISNPNGPDYVDSPEDGSVYYVGGGYLVQVPKNADGSVTDWEYGAQVDWEHGVEEADWDRMSEIKAALGAEH